MCTQAVQLNVHGVSAVQPVRQSCQLEHLSQQATGELHSLLLTDTQHMTLGPLASADSFRSRLLPAGVAHAIPDSQPTDEKIGRLPQDGPLPSKLNHVRKQRPSVLLRAAAAKRALDRDEAASKAKPAKQAVR